MSLPGAIYWIEEGLRVGYLGRAHGCMETAVVFYVCEIKSWLWLKHRIVESLRKGVFRMRAARRESVVHLELVSRCCEYTDGAGRGVRRP